MKVIANLLVSVALIALGIYVILFIPTVVDLSNIVIRLEDNEKIFSFLLYLPLVISIFNGLLTGANIFAKNTGLSIMNIVISIGVAVYIFVNVLNFRTIFDPINTKLNIVAYVNIACAVVLIAELIVSYVLSKKKKNLVPAN